MSESILRQKLDDFISRYHKMQLYRGIAAVVGISIFSFSIAAILEYYGRFGTTVRTLMFFSLTAFFVWILIKNIIIPLLRLFKLSRGTLSYEKASIIIGDFFPEVKDKLLNTLQLQKMASSNADNPLLIKAVEQKTEAISTVPFLKAINIEGVKKAGRFAAIAICLMFIGLIFNSGIFTDSGKRIVNFNKQFAVPAPFTFHLENPNPKVYKNQDYTLVLETKGKETPSEMYIVNAGNTIKMENSEIGKFTYTFRNIRSNRNFYFTTGKFSSDEYSIKVMPKPIIHNFKINLEYPSYLNKQNEEIENIGDLTIPKGTNITWDFRTQDADEISVKIDSVKNKAESKKRDYFTYKKRAINSFKYQIQISNKETSATDSIDFNVNIIEDEYPTIFAEQQKDSNSIYTNYLFGEASDDHGISRLAFFYKEKNSTKPFEKIELNVSGSFKQNFFLPINLKDFGIKQNEELEYYFKVWDNDRVSGPKSAKTPTVTLKRDSDKELEKQVEESGKALQTNMQNAISKASELQEKLKSLEKDLRQKSELTWEDQQKLNKLIEEQKKLQEQIQKLQEENKERNEFEEQFKKQNEELRKKQEQLQKMFEELFDDETKEMFKKLEEMLKQQNKDQIQEQLNKMNKDNKDLENMLDRTLEQFKQYELEKKINETIDKLEELAEKQEALQEKTEDSQKGDNDDLKQEQDELNKEFEDIQKDLEDLDLKNKNLENPMELDDTGESADDINSDMQKASDNISKNKKKDAGKSQQNAAQKMKELAQKMEKNLQENQQQQNEEDYNSLRQLLKNLVILSKSQEEILAEFNEIKDYNPRYIELSKKQKELRQSSLMIEDSLNNLAKRQPMISSYVTKELGSLTSNMEGAVNELSERNTGTAVVKQQYAMTHANNLAVFLTEILQDMQDEMNQQMEGKGDPKEGKPQSGSGDSKGSKGGKPKPGGMDGMKQLQDRLNKMMQDMQNGKMQDGKNPTSEEFAKTAAQQEALRRELQKIADEMREGGQANSELIKEIEKTIEKMQETERELYNKQINRNTIERQEDISHRLFEHEKAEREQGQDDVRKGETATKKDRKIPPSLEKYLKEKAREVEFYKTLPPEINPYYKEKVKEYFKNLQS